MSDPLAWLRGLPTIPGHGDDTRLLLVGHDMAKPNVTVWVGAGFSDDGNSFSICYATSEQPEELTGVHPQGAVPRLKPVTRTVFIGLEQLESFITSATDWAYDVDGSVAYAAETFLNAQLINGDTWNEHVTSWFHSNAAYAEWQPPAGNGHVGLLSRVQYCLGDYMQHVLATDDPRKLVLAATREVLDGEDVLRLKIRPDVFRAYTSGVVDRRLRAVLPGVEVYEFKGDDTDGQYTQLRQNHETILARRKFDPEHWDELTADNINYYLSQLPNDPVVRVAYGDHQLQVLLVLAFEPDKEEIEYIGSIIDGVTHASRAKPRRVYGRNVVSLLVPGLDAPMDERELDATSVGLAALEEQARDMLVFFD